MKTGAERYQRFIARKRFKLWFFALLPLVLTTASIALFTSSRFDVMCGAVVMYLFFVGLITHGTATDPFHELRGEKRDGTKRTANDV